MDITKEQLCRMIDHTNLKPFATVEEIDKLCKEAMEFGFIAVCVNQIWVEHCAGLLKGSGVSVASVVGFPLGANTPDVKAYEAESAVKAGAMEIDMVLDIAGLKSRDYNRVTRDIEMVVKASQQAQVKVILENCYLTLEEIEAGCRCSKEAGAAFVKTSTGFGDFGRKGGTRQVDAKGSWRQTWCKGCGWNKDIRGRRQDDRSGSQSPRH